MSLDQVVRRIVTDTVAASAPCNVIQGKVLKLSPPKVQITDKLIISGSQVAMTSTAKKGVAVDDTVLLIRVAGGQKFYIIDKVA